MKNPNKKLTKAMIIFNITGAILALGWGAAALIDNHHRSNALQSKAQARRSGLQIQQTKNESKLSKRKQFKSYDIGSSRTRKRDWIDIGDYKHKEKIIKHFQRFRRNSLDDKDRTPAKINLKLGKLSKKAQRKRVFKIREVLVSVETELGKNNFVALVNEDSGKILKKQGRRITEPLRRFGYPRSPSALEHR